MQANEVMGIIFPNAHEDMLAELTEVRSTASVPFGGRYRVIDFTLSNLVNAGITKVGVITKSNYHSLMDHIGGGRAWDLDRKQGGIFILPPYSTGDGRGGIYRGKVEALNGVRSFLNHCAEKYVVLCDGDTISNLDLEAIVDAHLQSDAHVTVAYQRGIVPQNHRDVMCLEISDAGSVTKISFVEKSATPVNYSIGVTVVARDLLLRMVEEATAANLTSFSRDVLQLHLEQIHVHAVPAEGSVTVLDGTLTYFNANMALLNKETRQQLFVPDRPVYTKTRDDKPAVYGLGSKVVNSIVADGCVVEGTVENSVLFRGVRVGKNATVRNCILMQDTQVEEDASIRYVVTDKNVSVSQNRQLTGSENYPMIIRKNSQV